MLVNFSLTSSTIGATTSVAHKQRCRLVHNILPATFNAATLYFRVIVVVLFDRVVCNWICHATRDTFARFVNTCCEMFSDVIGTERERFYWRRRKSGI